MNKTINTIIVILLLLTAAFVYPTTSQYEELVIKTPGIDIWEGGGYLINATVSNNILETDTDDIYYNQTLDIEVNSSFDWSEEYYFLWYPVYTGDIGTPYNLTWEKWTPTSGPSPTVGGTDYIFEDIYLQCSGLWIIDNDDNHTANTIHNMNNTIPAWFWVNASTNLEINAINTVTYNEDKLITVNVTKDDQGHKCLIDVRNTTTVFPQGNIWTDDPIGEYSFYSNNLTHAGDYTIHAYYDYDTPQIYYQEAPKYYDTDYGTTLPSPTNYNHAGCGPWDPPEYMAEPKELTVETAEPTITLTNTDVFWGFHSIMNVNVTDNNGKGLTDGEVTIKNRHDIRLTSIPPALVITNIGDGNYTVEFARGAANWNQLDTGNVNGTWYVCYKENINADAHQEWENEESFTVSSTPPDAALIITDDGQGDPKDLEINTLDYAAPIATTPITFVIYGGSITGPEAYYGDDTEETSDNITITGNILYTPSEDDGTLINHGNGYWTAIVIPSSTGSITISIDWENNQASKTINITHGTYVTTDISSFVVDKNTTLWVTVKDMNDNYEEYADILLIWEDDGTVINQTTGDSKIGNGKDGMYEFLIDTTQHRDTAPQKIIVCADTPGLGHWGYAPLTMIPNSDLIVECTPNTAYAGNDIEYTITVRSLALSATNSVVIPDDDGLVVELYDEDDNIVWQHTGDTDITENIILPNGTYYFYAYNDTHDSKDNNATLTISPYTVTSSPSVLAWLIDKDTTITFTVSPAGNGNLKLFNIDNDDVALPGTVTVEIVNGTGQLDGINAINLGNITYEYSPHDGEYQPADGMLKVTTATATPDPLIIYTNEPASVTITVTHPSSGAPISDVNVSLIGGILLTLPDEEVTDINGQVEFGITTGGSGDIIILIENEFDDDNTFVIKSKFKHPLKVTAPSTVQENKKFTIEITSNGQPVTDSVKIKFDGITYTTSTGALELTAPSVSLDIDYRIEAIATGYTDDETQTHIVNVRQLIILLDSPTVNGNEEIPITVTDDTGRPIIGATVTFSGSTYQTGENGKVTLTMPNTDQTYTLTTAFNGFQSDSTSLTVKSVSEKTPGFAFLTLIVSLGISLILLRRKQKL